MKARGITLLELVLGVALIGLVSLSFAFLYGNAQRNLVQSVNAVATQSESSFALEHIKRNLSRATDILIPAVGANGDTVQFRFQDALAGNAVTAEYTLAGTDLRYDPDTGTAGTEIIARNITDLSFDRTDRAVVRVTVTSQQGGQADQLQATITARGVF